MAIDETGQYDSPVGINSSGRIKVAAGCDRRFWADCEHALTDDRDHAGRDSANFVNRVAAAS
jgi:hypothetical protein